LNRHGGPVSETGNSKFDTGNWKIGNREWTVENRLRWVAAPSFASFEFPVSIFEFPFSAPTTSIEKVS
jgi:hypothetical protein